MLELWYAAEEKKIKLLPLNGRADLDHPVFGVGNESNPPIMFIGEAPGKDEAAQGRPFVGKAGKQLDEMLMLAGIDRSEVFVTNAVKYRPYREKNGRYSNRTPSPDEVMEGLQLLNREISLVSPSVIATLGKTPLHAVIMLARGLIKPPTVGEVHGKPFSIFINGSQRTVFPLYHPAACIYNRELKPVLEADLKHLGEHVRQICEQ